MKKIVLLACSLCMFTLLLHAQTRSITGRVYSNETGQPLPGVSITPSGNGQGTVTDENGRFTLSVPSGKVIVITVSHTGYASQQVTLGNQAELTIRLVPESQQLSDVVVVGYGTVKKKDLTGAVASISSSDIVRSNPANAQKAMQGQFAGVNITKASNKPGQDFTMTIRGENTITGVTEPLVVIDGVIGGRIRDINPADILTIDVLKDASSTAIYGSRGANGVVIITTKKGNKGKPQLSIDSYFGSKNPAHMPKFQTAQQFYKMTYTDRIRDGGSPILFTANELNVINSGQSTDWIDLMTKSSLQMGHTASVTGGSDNTTYRFSGGYIQEDGSIPHNTYKKYTLNGAMESKINSFIKVGFNVFFNYSENPTGSFEALRSAYRARPTGVAYYDQLVNPADGYDATIEPFDGLAVWMGIKDSQVMNPLIEADPANYQFQINARNQMGNAYAEITLLKGLTFRSSISGSLIAEKQGEFRGTYTKDRAGTKLPRSFYDTRDMLTYTIDNLLTYNKSFNKHKLTVTALQSAYKNVAEAYHIAVEDLPFASLWYNVGTAGTISGVSSNYERNTLQSYMGRVNYSFNDKYLLTLTGRSDGASQLSNGNKWAFFPSAAVAWRISDEGFMRSVNAVSDLKLRVSYGQVGNATVSPYSTQAAILNTPYNFGDNAAFGFAPSNLGNKDLKWERSEELNFGLDMGFLQNRIRATVEVYDRKTRDLILNTQLPTSTGFTSVYANVGKVGNKGIEVALNTVNIQTKDLSWSTALTFSKNKNKILALASGVTADVGNKLFVGSSVRSNYYYQFAGIWQSADSAEAASYGQRPGSVRVVDQDKNGQISSAAGKDDRVVLGTELPKWLLGMTNRFNYKDFDLSFFLYYRKGGQFRNGLLSGTMGDYSNTRYNHIVLNYWTHDNPTNDYYGVVASQPYKEAIQYEDASFLRLSDITLGYTLPTAKLASWGVNRMRVYGQVTNPYISTKYHGLDPEYNGNTYKDEVPTIIYTFGVNLTF